MSIKDFDPEQLDEIRNHKNYGNVDAIFGLPTDYGSKGAEALCNYIRAVHDVSPDIMAATLRFVSQSAALAFVHACAVCGKSPSETSELLDTHVLCDGITEF